MHNYTHTYRTDHDTSDIQDINLFTLGELTFETNLNVCAIVVTYCLHSFWYEIGVVYIIAVIKGVYSMRSVYDGCLKDRYKGVFRFFTNKV